MGAFKIQDQKRDIQLKDTHYHAWLKDNEVTNIHNSLTKVNYLKDQGFQIGIDFISETEIETLNYIEQHYFRTVLKPMLNNLVKEYTNGN
jgi:ribulose bisphosphate carboxylase small subunit